MIVSTASFRRLILSAGFFAASLWSAGTASANEPPGQLITFCMIGGKEVFGVDDAPDQAAPFKFRAGRVVHDLALTPGKLAGPFLRSAEAMIQVYREQPSADPAKPPQIISVAETTASASWRNIMVLVSLNEATGAVSLTPLDQSLATIPAGTIRFINLTKSALAVKVGKTQGTVPPQGHLGLPCGIAGDMAEMVAMRVAAEIEGQGRIVNSTSQALDRKDRRLALIYPGQIRAVQVLLLRPAPPDPVKPKPVDRSGNR
jgi:hypothetical protein